MTIHIIPKIIPKITLVTDDIFSASGIKSKLTIAVIKPAAKDNMKLRILFDGFFKKTPIIPPIVVPNVPKNSPNKVTLIKSLKFISS